MEQVDSHFDFLSADQGELLSEILARRNPRLFESIRHAGIVTRPEAEQIMSVLSDELADNLDDDWEPTEHGRAISAALAQFNAARVSEWP